MTLYTWYPIFNKRDFADTELTSRAYTITLDDIGEKSFLVTKGFNNGFVYDDTFFPLDMAEATVFEMDDLACFVDSNNDVWIGYPVEEE